MNWIELTPEVAEEYQNTAKNLMGFSEEWIHGDFNPAGVRPIHWCDISGWVSVRWNDSHDCYMTDESCCDSSESGVNLNATPTHIAEIVGPNAEGVSMDTVTSEVIGMFISDFIRFQSFSTQGNSSENITKLYEKFNEESELLKLRYEQMDGETYVKSTMSFSEAKYGEVIATASKMRGVVPNYPDPIGQE